MSVAVLERAPAVFLSGALMFNPASGVKAHQFL
jgi:hypothetical protein